MHIVSKFQFFTHISIVVKLKNKIQNFKRGEKKENKSLFLQIFQCCISQWIDKIKASFLDQNNAYYVVYQMCKNIVVIKICNVSKHKKSTVHFFGTSKMSKTHVAYQHEDATGNH